MAEPGPGPWWVGQRERPVGPGGSRVRVDRTCPARSAGLSLSQSSAGFVAHCQPPARGDREGLRTKHSRLLNERVQIWQQSWFVALHLMAVVS